MKFFDVIRLAWRTIAASRMHSFLVMVIIALALAEVVLITAFGMGVEKLKEQDKVQSTQSLQFDVRPAADAASASAQLLNTQGLAQIDALPEVEAASGVIEKKGKLVSGPTESEVVIAGIDNQYAAVTDIAPISGHLPQKGEVVLTDDLIQVLGLSADTILGKSMSLVTGDIPYAGVVAKETKIEVKVVGIVQHGAATAYASLADLRLFTINEPFTVVKVKTASLHDAQRTQSAVAQLGFTPVTRQSIAAGNSTTSRLLDHLQDHVLNGLGLISLLIFLIIALNTLAVAINHWRGDFIALHLMGAKNRDIVRLVATEMTLITTFAGVLAIVFAFVLSQLTTLLVAIISHNAPHDQVIFFSFSLPLFGITVATSFIVGLIAGSYIGWDATHAHRLDTVEYD